MLGSDQWPVIAMSEEDSRPPEDRSTKALGLQCSKYVLGFWVRGMNSHSDGRKRFEKPLKIVVIVKQFILCVVPLGSTAL